MALDIDGAIRELVAARPHVTESDDVLSLGTLDFNLAALYLQQKRYGSALEAAWAAAASYTRAESVHNRNRALAAVGAALVKMDRNAEAERVLEAVLREAPEEPGQVERTWIAEAMGALATVYRHTGRVKQADELDRARVRLGAQPYEEIEALE